MDEIVIYETTDRKTEITVKFEGDTVWLSQMQMAELFGQSKQNISLHINNCFKEKELNSKSTVKESLTVQTEGKRTVTRKTVFYNLDVKNSAVYGLNSEGGAQVRQCVTQQNR